MLFSLQNDGSPSVTFQLLFICDHRIFVLYSQLLVCLSELFLFCELKLLFLSFVLQYVNYLQRKYSLNSLKLLGHTAPAQAASLLILGPFVDFWLTRNRIDTFHYTTTVTVCNQMKRIYGIMILANIQ